ncbi:HD domain-containing protein [bacterium]|nr:HD domain-containing protein [bacterium]
MEEDSCKRSRQIIKISQLFSLKYPLPVLLEKITEETCKVFAAERSSIFVVDRKRRSLWTIAATGVEILNLPIDEGIAGYVAITGEEVFIPDAYKDSRFSPKMDRITGFHTKNIAALPLFDPQKRITGVWELLNIDEKEAGEEQFELLRIVAGEIAVALSNALLFDQLKKSLNSFIMTLALTIDERHPFTRGHTKRVAEYSVGIAKEMGLPEDRIEKIRIAAILHDYGKIAIPDSILKKAGSLTPEEYEIMKTHSQLTYDILKNVELPEGCEDVVKIASLHHERIDGSGYPYGLSDDQIPIEAQIIGIADEFDAATTIREYSGAKSFKTAKKEIEEQRGKKFSEEVTDAFIRYLEKYLKNR